MENSLLVAASPSDAKLLGELQCSIIIGDLASAVDSVCSEGNTIVDIQDAIGSTWRPDGGRSFNVVRLGVSLSVGELGSAKSAASCSSVGCILRKVVRGDEVGIDAIIKTDVAVIGSLQDGH